MVPGLYDHTALVQTIAVLKPAAAVLVSRVRVTDGLEPFLAQLRGHFQWVEVTAPKESSVRPPPDEKQFVVIKAWGFVESSL